MRGLGVASDERVVFLLYESREGEFRLASSRDGDKFEMFASKATLAKGTVKEALKKISAFRVARTKLGAYFATYLLRSGKNAGVYGATSKNFLSWKKTRKLSRLKGSSVVVSDYTWNGKYVAYFGDGVIRVATSKDLKSWAPFAKPMIGKRTKQFDHGAIHASGAFVIKEGILVFYYSRRKVRGTLRYAVGAALFDKEDPMKLLWRSALPLWEEGSEWSKKDVYPIGVVSLHGRPLFYWDVSGEIFSFSLTSFSRILTLDRKEHTPSVVRSHLNPILAPKGEHHWESRATFNPAALREGGKTHIIYRAIGNSDISVLGYAASTDGFTIDARHTEPAFVPLEHMDDPKFKLPKFVSPYMSGGGGYGGSEDPRLTKIGDRVYMTYVAYDGWSAPRVALTSIDVNDFLAHRWNWAKPVLISAPGVVNKNACILPEKVKGKYVIFHRVFPDILVDYVDDLEFDGKTKWLEGHYKIAPRDSFWDSRKLGAGATPIKTKKGWLMIYQGVDDRDAGRYKIGAMLLDLKDPKTVLARARMPVMEPEEWYENEGHKSGVVYPCGAAVVDHHLFVYYGGADTFVGVASAPLDVFLDKLMNSEEPQLHPATILS